jgi:hypothetical protein
MDLNNLGYLVYNAMIEAHLHEAPDADSNRSFGVDQMICEGS